MRLLVRFESRKNDLLYDVCKLYQEETPNIIDTSKESYLVISRLWPEPFTKSIPKYYRIQMNKKDGDYITEKYNSFEEFMEDNLELFL